MHYDQCVDRNINLSISRVIIIGNYRLDDGETSDKLSCDYDI